MYSSLFTKERVLATGYIQRQLIKSMEDLVVQHDGTVRDANNNIIQFHYGEDGTAPTKIETQSLPIGKLSHEEIRTEFGMTGVDWSTVLKDGVVRDNESELLGEYINQLLFDQRMMVEGVFQSKSLDADSVFAPVNLARWILNIKTRFALKNTEKTDLTPSMVLDGIKRVITRTYPYHKIWCALLRYHLAPHKLIVKERFTKDAFEMLLEIIVVSHMKAWVQPGDQVGIVAAQSIGEPATQMSSLGSTVICITNGKNFRFYGTISKFIDSLLAKNPEKVMQIANESVVMPLDDDYYIVGVSENEKTSWRRISEISRHPANGGLVEVVTRTGRRTTATLSHSFLKRSPTGIVPVLGSDLQVGMRIPIARYIPEVPGALTQITQGETTFTLDREFGWVCGIYLADGCLSGNTVKISKVHPRVEEKLKPFSEKYGIEFTIREYTGEFGPSKDNNLYSKDLKDFMQATFKTGSYAKEIGTTVFHSNREFIAGIIGGYFDGDGNISVERQLIRASSRSKKLIEQICALLGYCGLFGVLSQEKSKRMKDKIQYTLMIPRKFAKEFQEEVGLELSEKAAALNEIVKYNERDYVHSQQEMVDKIPELGEIIAETGKLLKMPGCSRTYGRWTKKESIGRRTLQNYVSDFEEMMAIKVHPDVEDAVKENLQILKSALAADVVWDEIVDLIYHADPKEYVYDFTVPGNDSFMVDNNILVHNTLNSVDWDTEIVISKNGKIITPKIGEFIDNYYKECKDESKIQYYPNNQVYIELNDGNDWKAISCDEDGNMKWTKLEAITRHPVVNDDGTNTILKVVLDSGREVKATKGKSFLTLQNGKIVATNGSDLKVGDSLPIANSLAMDQLGYMTEINLREYLSPKEYIYGTDVQKAMETMNTWPDRHWFSKNNGTLFTVPYNRSDSFRDAFQKGKNSNDIRPGCVYNKRMKLDVSQIPETIPLNKEVGFFCGAYLAEGMSNNTQIHITNNDSGYLDRVKNLMDSWNVGTHTTADKRVIESTGIKGTTTSLVIHSTILAKVFKTWFGRVSYEKNIPNWVLQAPDEFLKGLIDGYISGDGTVNKKSGCVSYSSVSKQLVEGIQSILARYGIYSKLTSRMPQLRKFKSVSRQYTVSINNKYSSIFAKTFVLSIKYKQDNMDNKFNDTENCRIYTRNSTTNDVVWDKIKSIEEVLPLGEGWVYDLTVESTRNFMTKQLIVLADTFHQAGVASKSAVTRGVPRLRELLKVTQNPKATSLTIHLKPEYRNNKDKAREVVQDLELTLLRNITNKVAIYWDTVGEMETVVPEDEDLLRFYKLFEEGLMADEGLSEAWSQWVLRLELNREEMFNRNISIQEVVSVVKNQWNHDINIVYSDYNSDKLVMRIRLPNKDNDTAAQLDDFTNLKKFQNKLLNSVVIRGLPGIKAVTFRKDKQQVEMQNGKYEVVEQYVLDTDGSNFIKVMNHPAVDGTRLYSTNVWDVYEVLGIEATRAVLFNEIQGLFESVGVNYRHLCLLCDVMTRFGKLMSIDRYGINKNDIGTLAKASFEETEKILLKAALFGEIDPVTGVSANIMMGQPIRGGTAFSQVLMDDQMLSKLLESVNIENYKKGMLENEEEGDISGLGEAGLQLADPCSSTQFQMNMVLPSGKAAIEEPEIELDIIDK
jgi:DNA-directed RNA polymerase beta' subunit